MSINSDTKYKELADYYDEEVKNYGSYAHEVIFGMCYDFISPDEKLLDIGIGTGLSSEKFSKAGMQVYGVDTSSEMLATSKSKSFTKKLVECDVVKEPLPFDTDFFHQIICCGVLHFIGDLSQLFTEIKRVLKPEGVFSFSIAPTDSQSNYIKEPTEWGIPIFKHTSQYVDKLINDNYMEILKEQRILIKGEDKQSYNMQFSVIVCKLKSLKHI